MKKITLTLALILLGVTANAQNFKVLKTENSEWGTTSFRLDCIKRQPLLANKLFYTITKEVFDSKSKKDIYHVSLILKDSFKPTLNKELTISSIFEDGTIITSKETLEDGGNFNGVCTIDIKLLNFIKKVGLKEIRFNGASNKSFMVNKKNRVDFIENLNNIVDSE
jgi:hypothetical protein